MGNSREFHSQFSAKSSILCFGCGIDRSSEYRKCLEKRARLRFAMKNESANSFQSPRRALGGGTGEIGITCSLPRMKAEGELLRNMLSSHFPYQWGRTRRGRDRSSLSTKQRTKSSECCLQPGRIQKVLSSWVELGGRTDKLKQRQNNRKKTETERRLFVDDAIVSCLYIGKADYTKNPESAVSMNQPQGAGGEKAAAAAADEDESSANDCDELPFVSVSGQDNFYGRGARRRSTRRELFESWKSPSRKRNSTTTDSTEGAPLASAENFGN